MPMALEGRKLTYYMQLLADQGASDTLSFMNTVSSLGFQRELSTQFRSSSGWISTGEMNNFGSMNGASTAHV
jgi:hypothetical protein